MNAQSWFFASEPHRDCLDALEGESPEGGDGPGLLVSPAFWVGGVLSVAVWMLIGWAVR